MAFDIYKFLDDNSIEYPTEGGRYRPGWVQIHCPFCGGSSRGFDLGFYIDGNYFNCWQCRGKSIVNVIKKLLNVPYHKAKEIQEQYEGRPTPRIPQKRGQIRAVAVLPPGCREMGNSHIDYLVGRKYDPFKLEREFGLLGTDHLGEYKFRIIAPIYYEGKLVSYQGRDITNRAPLRWKACEKENEAIHHKHILYNIDNVEGDSVLIVEGASDVWRMGRNSVGTFGTGFTVEQSILIARRFKKIFLMYDPEPAALRQADELSWKLSTKGKEVYIVDELEEGKDPGDMKQDDADALMRELNLRR